MITINGYTANWDNAVPMWRKRGRIRAGVTLVRIHNRADVREYDAFQRSMDAMGLECVDLVRWMPRARMNVYRITRRN